ncbi:MAG: hypothetical protein GXP13_04430 [Gammaproteobacteria bacterium]|nr:hypothetical protein [Gammaproteobacteria bacterium]
MFTNNLNGRPNVMLQQIALITVLFIVTGSAQAGGWLRSEGEHRYSAYLSNSSSNRSWDRYGNDTVSGCTSNVTALTHEYEYGYSYYRTLFGKVNMATSECGGDKVSGLGDVYLGVRGRLNLYKNGSAWEAILIIPTGYDGQRSNRLGYGELGIELGLYGTTKYSKKSTFAYGGSFRFWNGSPSDQFRTRASWSYKQNKQWAIRTSLEGNFSLNNGNSVTPASINGDFESEFDVIRGKIGLRRQIGPRLGLTVGLYKNLWGRNASQRQGIYLNIAYVWGRL